MFPFILHIMAYADMMQAVETQSSCIADGEDNSMAGTRAKRTRGQPVTEPDKPWRVHATSGFTTDHRSMATAFEQVKVVHRWGLAASVYRWRDDGWELYRHMEPPQPDPAQDSWPFLLTEKLLQNTGKLRKSL